jgi:hypothetical protein
MNIIKMISKRYTYREIAQQIKQTTGRDYNHLHIGNVARGSRAMSDSLKYHILLAFPEFFTPTTSPNSYIDNQEVKA